MSNRGQSSLIGLAKYLVKNALLSEKNVLAALAASEIEGISFPAYLWAKKPIPSYVLLEVLSTELQIPYIYLEHLNANKLYRRNPSVCDKLVELNAIPLYVGVKDAVVIVSDPIDELLLTKIRHATGRHFISYVVAIPELIVEKLAIFMRYKGIQNFSEDEQKSAIASETEKNPAQETHPKIVHDVTFDNAVNKLNAFVSTKNKENESGNFISLDEGSLEEEAPIIFFIESVLTEAIHIGASDIHFEPYELQYRVRYRIDGSLKEVATPPKQAGEVIAARLKVIAMLDISEKRLPQDGRLRFRVSANKVMDFRVSTLPTIHGEKIVLRILNSDPSVLSIDVLGYDDDQKKQLLEAIHRPYGMVLVTGPTGSGKTVSLYTCLNILNQPDINIATVEDPVEIQLPGINQVSTHEKIGFNFARILKAFLRQDPDIVMLGEIRDIETAEIAIKAAQTGHMVLSTLHTNDAPSTITRMVNMGIPSYNIASAVSLITAQRLVPRLCSKCKIPVVLTSTVLLAAGYSEEESASSIEAFEANHEGCDVCGGSGYKGRLGIYEVMPLIPEIIDVILRDGGNSTAIAKVARQAGIKSMRQSGLLKVKQGLTSLGQIIGATN